MCLNTDMIHACWNTYKQLGLLPPKDIDFEIVWLVYIYNSAFLGFFASS